MDLFPDFGPSARPLGVSEDDWLDVPTFSKYNTRSSKTTAVSRPAWQEVKENVPERALLSPSGGGAPIAPHFGIITASSNHVVHRSRKTAIGIPAGSRAPAESPGEDTATVDRLRATITRLRDALKDSEARNTELISVSDRLRGELAEKSEEVERLRGMLAARDATARNMRDKLQDITGCVRVVCRVKPVSVPSVALYLGATADETKEGLLVLPPSYARRVESDPSPPTTKDISLGHRFQFDRVFRQHATQLDLFTEFEPLLNAFLKGTHACIFTYGATGSGKTFTMEGVVGAGTVRDVRSLPSTAGIIPRALAFLLNHCRADTEDNAARSTDSCIALSCFEIYNDVLRDLLAPEVDIYADPTDTRPTPSTEAAMSTLTCAAVTTGEEMSALIASVSSRRAIAATRCNASSSRSHVLYRACLVPTASLAGRSSVSVGRVKLRRVESHTASAYLLLVDLAGSERNSDSWAEGKQLTEACHVNKSLTALGHVMTALSRRDGFIPYRQSKLTHVLEPCLTRDAKCLMIVTIDPSVSGRDMSLHSLRFAESVSACVVGDRAKPPPAPHKRQPQSTSSGTTAARRAKSVTRR